MARAAAPVSLGSPRFSTVDCGTFLVTNAHFPVGHTIENHFHDRAVVGITLQGNWDSVLGSTRLANSPGILHVEPAGDSHVNRFGASATQVVIVQPNPADDMVAHPFRELLESAGQVRIGCDGLLMAGHLQSEFIDRDDLSSLAIEGLAMNLLIVATRSYRSRSGSTPKWLLRTVDFLHERFLECPTIGELSVLAGVSAEHFSREFRRFYRVTPAAYLRNLRLDWAAEHLSRHPESVAEIASLAGFADQSHFTRRFRKQFGQTPAAFRAAGKTKR